MLYIAYYFFQFIIINPGLTFSNSQQQDYNNYATPGYHVHDFTVGHLNKDNHKDVILVLKKDNEKSRQYSHRVVKILIGSGQNQFFVVAQNKNLVVPHDAINRSFSEYGGIEITEKGVFSIYHTGGVSDLWELGTTFKYSEKLKGWFFYSETLSKNTEINTKIETKTRTVFAKQLPKLASFEKYTILH